MLERITSYLHTIHSAAFTNKPVNDYVAAACFAALFVERVAHWIPPFCYTSKKDESGGKQYNFKVMVMVLSQMAQMLTALSVVKRPSGRVGTVALGALYVYACSAWVDRRYSYNNGQQRFFIAIHEIFDLHFKVANLVIVGKVFHQHPRIAQLFATAFIAGMVFKSKWCNMVYMDSMRGDSEGSSRKNLKFKRR